MVGGAAIPQYTVVGRKHPERAYLLASPSMPYLEASPCGLEAMVRVACLMTVHDIQTKDGSVRRVDFEVRAGRDLG